MSGESWSNYVRQDWDADDEEIRRPPTTHFVATVDDLTDMLDFDSEDIDGMDDEQEPLPTGHWTPTSSHDVYMVDTPKENNDEERKDAAKGGSLEQQSKRRRKRPSTIPTRFTHLTLPPARASAAAGALAASLPHRRPPPAPHSRSPPSTGCRPPISPRRPPTSQPPAMTRSAPAAGM